LSFELPDFEDAIHKSWKFFELGPLIVSRSRWYIYLDRFFYNRHLRGFLPYIGLLEIAKLHCKSPAARLRWISAVRRWQFQRRKRTTKWSWRKANGILCDA
jgi:hypothetical protein